MTLILASQSVARQNMLRGAGFHFEARPADLDEDAITAQNADKTPAETAQILAQSKALHIAAQNPNALVIGADQILECEGEMLTKAQDKNDATQKLKSLRAKTHRLISAACVAKGNKILWSHTEDAALTMRDFDDAFLETYIESAGEALTRSVGAYELESTGVQLFEEIKGDYFTILGMPLLPLLKFLRKEGISL